MEVNSSKPKWMIETYWSLSTPLAFFLPSWRYVEESLYLSEYILTLRMRDYMMNEPCKDCKGKGCDSCNGTGKEYQLNSIMCDCKEVVMSA